MHTVKVPHTYAALINDQNKPDEMQERFQLMQTDPSSIKHDISEGLRVVDKKGKTLLVVIPDGVPVRYIFIVSRMRI